MAEPARQPWTTDAFFAWQQRQADRYELVGGLPLRLMAGAKNRHDDVVVNLLTTLRTRLRGGPCRPFSADGSIETRPGQIRRPDVGVDCGRRDPDAYKAAEPKLVAEVLSPSTRDVDTIEKLGEYKALEAIRTILVIESNAPQIVVWSRTDSGWVRTIAEGLDDRIAVTDLGLELPLSEIFDGIDFPSGPHLKLA